MIDSPIAPIPRATQELLSSMAAGFAKGVTEEITKNEPEHPEWYEARINLIGRIIERRLCALLFTLAATGAKELKC